jgi:hypothetical protein
MVLAKRARVASLRARKLKRDHLRHRFRPWAHGRREWPFPTLSLTFTDTLELLRDTPYSRIVM